MKNFKNKFYSLKKLKEKLSSDWFLLLIALALASVAAFTVKVHLDDKERELNSRLLNNQDHVELSDVVVASRELGIGEIVSSSNMSIRSIPRDLVPMDAVTPSQFNSVEGMALLSPIAQGRPLLLSYLPEKRVHRFSDLLEEGRRAITIRVDEINSSAGLLKPGDTIDLYLLFKEPGLAKPDHSLKLMVEKATVLATGTNTKEHQNYEKLLFADRVERYSTVTLDLSLKDSLRVRIAEGLGDFVTLLRGNTEVLPVDKIVFKESELFQPSIPKEKIEIITRSAREHHYYPSQR
ncbi:MAG: Flp pilus assembly protein CpaB [Alkalimonas sp.]|nr:Flp pilus assembly protein CpaB [Alkalimonas sp.]